MATWRDTKWGDWTAYDSGGDRMILEARFNSNQDGAVTADTAYLDVYADIVAIYDIGVGDSISDTSYYFKRDAGSWGAWGPGMDNNISDTADSEGRVYKFLNTTHAIRIWLQFGAEYSCQLRATHGDVEKIGNTGNNFTATLKGTDGVWGNYPRRPYHAPSTPTNGNCWVDDVNGKLYLQISGNQNDPGQDRYWDTTDFTIYRSTDGQWHETSGFEGNTTQAEWDIVPDSYYKVGARSWNEDGGESAWSTWVNRYSKPDAPTVVTVARQATRTSVKVAWTNNASYPEDFLIERSVDSGTTWNLAGTVTGSLREFTDTAPLNVNPRYRVLARTPGNQALSDYSAATADTGFGYAVPDAPVVSLARVDDASATITISGNQSNSTLDKFWDDLYWELQTDSGSFVVGGSVNGDVQTIQVSGLSADHRYRVQARAWNAAGYGGYGQSGYIYTTPAAPTVVTAARVGTTTTVNVGWTNNARWPGDFVVEASFNSGAYAQVATAAASPTTATQSTTSYGTYRVKTRTPAPAVTSVASAPSGTVVPAETDKRGIPGIDKIRIGTNEVYRVMAGTKQIWLG